jgi:hypothetical protein
MKAVLDIAVKVPGKTDMEVHNKALPQEKLPEQVSQEKKAAQYKTK